MLCLKTLPYLHRPCSSLKSHHLLYAAPKPLLSPPISFSATTYATSATAMAVEHVVLFKVRDFAGAGATAGDAMVAALNSLSSLPSVAHLSISPVLRRRSAAAESFAFTHLLHSRYASKTDLAAYAADPSHLAVVHDLVLPSCDDVLAVDWISDSGLASRIAPGSIGRLTLAKLKPGAAAEDLSLLASNIPGASEVSYGANFSPARAKDYSFAALAIYPSVEKLDEAAGGGEEVMKMKEDARKLVEDLIVVDFVVSKPPTASL